MTTEELRKLAEEWVALEEHETARVVLFGDEDLVGFIEWVEARLDAPTRS